MDYMSEGVRAVETVTESVVLTWDLLVGEGVETMGGLRKARLSCEALESLPEGYVVRRDTIAQGPVTDAGVRFTAVAPSDFEPASVLRSRNMLRGQVISWGPGSCTPDGAQAMMVLMRLAALDAEGRL